MQPPQDKDKAIKDLIKSIPRERKDVFAYSLKWDAFDANTDAILPKLSKWVHIHLAHPLSLTAPTSCLTCLSRFSFWAATLNPPFGLTAPDTAMHTSPHH